MNNPESHKNFDEPMSTTVESKLRHSSPLEAVTEAVSDLYSEAVLTIDYEKGDEGRFWPELFTSAIEGYEKYAGQSLSPEEIIYIKDSIIRDCELLATHGYSENLFDEDNHEEMK